MPPSTGADNAWWWIPVAAAALSLFSLGWQLSLYRLSGARLEVRLLPAILTPVGHIIRGPQSGWQSSIPEAMNLIHDGHWVDVAIIQVVNVGRSPVNVSDINLDFGASPSWKPWSRHTVGGLPLPVHEGAPHAVNERLEAGQALSVILDFWPLVSAGRVEAERRHRKRALVVRASAQAAGRRPRRSRWRRRWHIAPEQQFLWPHGPVASDMAIYQAVWRAVTHFAPDRTYEAWLAMSVYLMDHGVEELSVAAITEVLEGVFDDMPPMAVLDIWMDIQRSRTPAHG